MSPLKNLGGMAAAFAAAFGCAYSAVLIWMARGTDALSIVLGLAAFAFAIMSLKCMDKLIESIAPERRGFSVQPAQQKMSEQDDGSVDR
jgi:hypothetical protein